VHFLLTPPDYRKTDKTDKVYYTPFASKNKKYFPENYPHNYRFLLRKPLGIRKSEILNCRLIIKQPRR